MKRIRLIAAVALTAAVAGVAGCGSASTGGAPSPTATTTTPSAHGSVAARDADGQAMLVQCGLTQGTIKAPSGQPWYAGGKVLPLAGSGAGDRAAQFSTWWDAHKDTVVGGKSLADWVDSAAQADSLPAALCGSGASAASLMAQIYPGQASPW